MRFSNRKVVAGMALAFLSMSALSAYAVDASKLVWVKSDETSKMATAAQIGTGAEQAHQVGGKKLAMGGGKFVTMYRMQGVPADSELDLNRLSAKFFVTTTNDFESIPVFFDYDGNLASKLGSGRAAAGNLVSVGGDEAIVWDTSALRLTNDGWLTTARVSPTNLDAIYASPYAEKFILVRMQDGSVKNWNSSINKGEIEGISLKQIQNKNKS